MQKIFYALLVLIAALIGSTAPAAEEKATPPPKTETAAEIIARGDRLELEGKFLESVFAYLQALDGHPEEVEWRLARSYSDIGDMAPLDQKEAQFDLAIEHARKAVKADPKNSDSHAWLAVALGKKALYADSKKGVELSKEVKEEAEKAIALDADNFLPHVVLGIWNREVANLGFLEKVGAKVLYGGLPPASNEGSVKELERAIALRPDSVKANYELALTYIEMSEYAKAREKLKKVIDMPKVIALDEETKKRAAVVLKKL